MKNIAICCDGTGNEFGCNNTNVVETYLVLEKDEAQIAYYDPGVGTGGWEYHEERGELRAMGDQATGHGLQKNVEDAYRYLADHYEKGDRVYLFGFSRGAFTARSLAGMIFKCGLLRAGHDNLVEYASKIYNTENNAVVAADFLRAFGRPCPIHFIGVWDTVESLVMNAGEAVSRRDPESRCPLRIPRPGHRRKARGLPAKSLGRDASKLRADDRTDMVRRCPLRCGRLV